MTAFGVIGYTEDAGWPPQNRHAQPLEPKSFAVAIEATGNHETKERCMTKRTTAPAGAPAGWEVEPPPTMEEGYTWCPECQAQFEGDVCPGCSIGISPGISPETEALVAATGPQPGAQPDPAPDHPAPAAAGGQTTEGGEPETLEDVQEAVKAAELNVKTRNTTESLKCILTDDEIRRYGIAQARANAEIARAEEELQSVKSQYKSRIDAAAATRNDMAQRINNGYEFRQVECTERWDYGSNITTVMRTDTYETVSRRTMSRDEMQRKLF